MVKVPLSAVCSQRQSHAAHYEYAIRPLPRVGFVSICLVADNNGTPSLVNLSEELWLILVVDSSSDHRTCRGVVMNYEHQNSDDNLHVELMGLMVNHRSLRKASIWSSRVGEIGIQLRRCIRLNVIDVHIRPI